jgi:hypothetical protein
MKSNAMDANGAGRLGLRAGLGWVDNGHVLGPTTLSILDGCSTRAARGALFAGGSIGHAIVEVQSAVEFDRHLQCVDGEGGDASIGTAGNERA